MKHIIWILLVALLLFSCSGEDEPAKDNTPPTRPILIPHRGDSQYGAIYTDDNGNNIDLTEENNGIDTVPEGNWIRISWKPFQDNDLSHFKVFRFSGFEPEPIEIANRPANEDHYLDQGPLEVERWYSYFIELFDISGNSTISDTVFYAILHKTQPMSPADNAYINPDGLRFQWTRADDGTGFYRVLLWNQDNSLIWSEDMYPTAEDDDLLEIQLPILNPPITIGSTLRWRVDYFDWDADKQMYMGSESIERYFTTSQ